MLALFTQWWAYLTMFVGGTVMAAFGWSFGLLFILASLIGFIMDVRRDGYQNRDLVRAGAKLLTGITLIAVAYHNVPNLGQPRPLTRGEEIDAWRKNSRDDWKLTFLLHEEMFRSIADSQAVTNCEAFENEARLVTYVYHAKLDSLNIHRDSDWLPAWGILGWLPFGSLHCPPCMMTGEELRAKNVAFQVGYNGAMDDILARANDSFNKTLDHYYGRTQERSRIARMIAALSDSLSKVNLASVGAAATALGNMPMAKSTGGWFGARFNLQVGNATIYDRLTGHAMNFVFGFLVIALALTVIIRVTTWPARFFRVIAIGDAEKSVGAFTKVVYGTLTFTPFALIVLFLMQAIMNQTRGTAQSEPAMMFITAILLSTLVAVVGWFIAGPDKSNKKKLYATILGTFVLAMVGQYLYVKGTSSAFNLLSPDPAKPEATAKVSFDPQGRMLVHRGEHAKWTVNQYGNPTRAPHPGEDLSGAIEEAMPHQIMAKGVKTTKDRISTMSREEFYGLRVMGTLIACLITGIPGIILVWKRPLPGIALILLAVCLLTSVGV